MKIIIAYGEKSTKRMGSLRDRVTTLHEPRGHNAHQ